MHTHEPLDIIKMSQAADQEFRLANDSVNAGSTAAYSVKPEHSNSSDVLIEKRVLPPVDLDDVSGACHSGKGVACGGASETGVQSMQAEAGLNKVGYLPNLHLLIPDRDHDAWRDSGHQCRDLPDDRSRFSLVGEEIKRDGEFKEMRLDNRAASHPGSDALVYVRKDFDACKPVNLVIYNHGFGSTVSNALERNQIKDMMAHAQPNTVFVMPEWQASPGTRSGNSGTFAQPDKFTHMLQEIMQKTPALHGATLDNVTHIDIIAHSAGYSPTEAEIYKNPALSDKIRSITLLDSLYDKHGFDKWLGDNISDLSAGRKRFCNFSNSSTSSNSRDQARLVASLLRQKGLSAYNYVADYGSSKGHVERHADEMAKRSIVFASTSTEHLAIPGHYIAPTLAALNS